MRKPLAWLLLFGLWGVAPSAADPVRMTMTGTLDFAYPGSPDRLASLVASATVGTPFTARLVYDDSAPDRLPDDPTFGQYFPLLGLLTLTTAGRTLTLQNEGAALANRNDSPSLQYVQFHMSTLSPAPGLSVLRGTVTFENLNESMARFPDDRLRSVEDADLLSRFPSRRIDLQAATINGDEFDPFLRFGINAVDISRVAPTPEPATLLLIVGGGAVAMYVRRRNRVTDERKRCPVN